MEQEQELESPLLEESQAEAAELDEHQRNTETVWCEWAGPRVCWFVVAVALLTGGLFAVSFPWPWHHHHHSAMMIYDKDKQGRYTLTVHFPSAGYGVVKYPVESAIRDSPNGNEPDYEYEVWGDKGYSRDTEARKTILWTSDEPWSDSLFGPIEPGDSWAVPLETHYQFRSRHTKPTKTEAVAARCGRWLLLSKKHFKDTYYGLSRLVRGAWNSSDTTAVYGAYNGSTKEVNPRVSPPSFYGHVQYFSNNDDPVAPYHRRITVPAHYGLVTFEVRPSDTPKLSNFSIGETTFGDAQKHTFAPERTSNRPLKLPEDPDEYLLPPQRIVKISGWPSSDKGMNAAVTRRCGTYAVLTKRPEKLYNTIGMWIEKTWIVPNGKFEVVDADGYEVKVNVPESFAFVWYEVVPSAENATSHPFSLAYHSEELKSSDMSATKRIWHVETGDPRTTILKPEEHVRVLSTSMFDPVPNSSSLASKCGTYVVMTNDPWGVYDGLEAAVTNWTL